MAAYAALISLTQITDQLMHQHDQHHHPIILLTDQEQQIMKSLQEKLSFLQAFLEDNHPPNSKEEVDFLEARVRDAAYQAEDLIESHILNKIRSEYEWNGFKKGFLQLISTFQNTMELKIEELEKVIQEIDSIVEEAMKIKSMDENLPPIISTHSLSASSKEVVGLDDDLMKIKDWLCGESSKLQIISIVGMGGTGKTTLAKSTFDDSLIAYHFHARAWITISQQYCLRDILLTLLDSITRITEDLSDKGDEKLKEYVYKSLKGRRYLIVMDDMWGPNAWDDLRRILPDDCNGSRILLTTRLLDVAVYADNSRSHLHHMKFLNDDESWNLLREKVFAREECPLELEIIGKKIAEKCRGLPLAIVLVAGLMSKDVRTPEVWENLAENVSSSLAADDDQNFLKIMSLSYNHLPQHLKACFLYMGGFPEDYEIPILKLSKLWIAEGLLKPVGFKSLEKVAEEYLEDLVGRNLVLISKKSSIGKSRFCNIHDLLRDFCMQKAQDEDFLHVYKNWCISLEEVRNKRRLRLQNSWSFASTRRKLFPTRLTNAPNDLHIRSIIFSYDHESVRLSSLTSTSKLLRVFDGLEGEQNHELSIDFKKLLHLRYISFTRLQTSKEFVFPQLISRLRNLQTIIIRSNPSCSRSLELFYKAIRPNIYLPIEIWELPQLRHLILRDVCFLPNPIAPRKREKAATILQNLQTLSRIANFSLTKETIELIPNVKKLGVIYSHITMMNGSKYHLNNLSHLHRLESLDFTVDSDWKHPFPVDFSLPETLRKLTIRGCAFPWENMTIVGSLPNLEVLKLRFNAFVGEEWDTVEGQFPRLKFLMMESLPDLKYWRTECTHFPCLERLIIRYCENLEEIPREIGEISTLQLIELYPGSKSSVDSAMVIKEEQWSLGNDPLQIRIIDHVVSTF